MNDRAKIGAAVVAGYILGRTKKGRTAIRLAMWLTGRDYRPSEVLRTGGARLAQSPEAAKLADQLRGPLVHAAQVAATAAIEAQLERMTTAIQRRTEALTGTATGAATGAAGAATGVAAEGTEAATGAAEKATGGIRRAAGKAPRVARKGEDEEERGEQYEEGEEADQYAEAEEQPEEEQPEEGEPEEEEEQYEEPEPPRRAAARRGDREPAEAGSSGRRTAPQTRTGKSGSSPSGTARRPGAGRETPRPRPRNQ